MPCVGFAPRTSTICARPDALRTTSRMPRNASTCALAGFIARFPSVMATRWRIGCSSPPPAAWDVRAFGAVVDGSGFSPHPATATATSSRRR